MALLPSFSRGKANTGVPKAAPTGTRRFIKIIVVAFIIVAIFVVLFSIYISSQLRGIPLGPTKVTYGNVLLNGSLIAQDIIQQSNGTMYVPYAAFAYNESNATSLFAGVKIYSSNPPSDVYVLNWTNQCTICASVNVTRFLNTLTNNLRNDTFFNQSQNITMISQSQLPSIVNDSYLIILNGHLPDYLLTSTTLSTLLSKGTTIVYIGQNFSQLISQGGLLVPPKKLPTFLKTTSAFPAAVSGYYFDRQTFTFVGGTTIGPTTSISAFGGHIIAFSNYLTSWNNTSEAASDVSQIISGNKFTAVYANGAATLKLPNTRNVKSTIGVLMNGSNIAASQFSLAVLNGGYGVATLVAYSGNTVKAVQRIDFKPVYSVNASFSLPQSTYPGVPIATNITIYTNKTIEIEPHIDIYTRNYQLVASIPPLFQTRTISSSFSFFSNFTLPVGTGQYIAQLNGFSGQHFASAYFVVPQIFLRLYGANLTTGQFQFIAQTPGHNIGNTTANVTLDGKYKQSVSVVNGTFVYTLPTGTAVPTGNLTFSVSLFNEVSIFRYANIPPGLTINKQYIEFIIALVIVMLEITLVKAPNRDEFNIDVSSLPGPQKTPIRLKPNDLINAFDLLNKKYKWQYMPLSNNEFKTAILDNIRSNNLQVNLTYNNTEMLLDSMLQKGYLVSADSLYAPTAWVEQSKHDVEYLAIFKKLRVWLVAHGHTFTDLDKSDVADIVTKLHNEQANLVFYSKTSKFLNKLPVQKSVKTYIVFLNSDKMEEFRQNLNSTSSAQNETLKMYISIGMVGLIDADDPEGILT